MFSENGEGVEELLEGKISIPLPTYFTVGTTPLPQKIIDKIETDDEVSAIYSEVEYNDQSCHRSARTSIT